MDRTEFYITQPVVMAEISVGRSLWGRVALNAEAATLSRGELTPGAWGEGWFDRRHPHTVVHELMAGVVSSGRCGGTACALGIFAGKGFVPFGSDDPMSRPLVAYPVNHHLAQILERLVAGAQVRLGAIAVEGGLFNGDEPDGAWRWPRVSRFADSWAARLTVTPITGIELSASHANVASPEARSGVGPDQRKWHVAGRFQGGIGPFAVTGLAEWAQTDEVDGFFRFDSALLEAGASRGSHRFAYRFERTDRPEEERISTFRAVRPHHDNSLVGITRWVLHTAQYRYRATIGPLRADPFVEVTIGRITEVGGGLFDVVDTFGNAAVRRLALGARVAWRLDDRHRMGRYGVVAAGHRSASAATSSSLPR